MLESITIRHLLYHAGGWNRDLVDDPGMPGMVLPISGVLGLSGPADATQNIRFMLNQPLQFQRGTEMHYSNLGYWALSGGHRRVAGAIVV